jgi:hypothetical protein
METGGRIDFRMQITSDMNISDWQTRNDRARLADQQLLHSRLSDLEANQSKLAEALGMHS